MLQSVREWKSNVHSEKARQKGQGEHDGGEDREGAHRQVNIVGKQRLVRIFQRFDDLFLGTEYVPQAFDLVYDIVEIDHQIFRQETLLFMFQGGHHGSLRQKDLTERDNVLFQYHDIEKLVFGPFGFEDLIFYLFERDLDFVGDRKDGVKKNADQFVKQISGALTLAKKELARPDRFLAGFRQFIQGFESALMDRDQIIRADEHVQLFGVEAVVSRVVDGELKDDE